MVNVYIKFINESVQAIVLWCLSSSRMNVAVVFDIDQCKQEMPEESLLCNDRCLTERSRF